MTDREYFNFTAEEENGIQDSSSTAGIRPAKSQSTEILERLDRIERQLALLIGRQPASFGDTDRRDQR